MVLLLNIWPEIYDTTRDFYASHCPSNTENGNSYLNITNRETVHKITSNKWLALADTTWSVSSDLKLTVHVDAARLYWQQGMVTDNNWNIMLTGSLCTRSMAAGHHQNASHSVSSSYWWQQAFPLIILIITVTICLSHDYDFVCFCFNKSITYTVSGHNIHMKFQ